MTQCSIEYQASRCLIRERVAFREKWGVKHDKAEAKSWTAEQTILLYQFHVFYVITVLILSKLHYHC